MKRRVFVLALLIAATTASESRPAALPPVQRLVGNIGPANAVRALAMIADNQDKIIGLQIGVAGGSDEQFAKFGYLVSNDEPDYFLVSAGKDGGYEVLVKNGYRWEHGGYVIDGFYLVKSGGMHQGTLSYGLEPVSEADVRLRRTVVDRPIR